jgi:hypothetical protein
MSQDAKTTSGTLKKKRGPKKTVLGAVENNLDYDMANMLSLADKNNEKEMKSTVSKLGNHFQFGNQVGLADGASNKTSNNKLDQSMRISYAEMAETLKSYSPEFSNSIEAINKAYEETYFSEWLRLLKYDIYSGLFRLLVYLLDEAIFGLKINCKKLKCHWIFKAHYFSECVLKFYFVLNIGKHAYSHHFFFELL